MVQVRQFTIRDFAYRRDLNFILPSTRSRLVHVSINRQTPHLCGRSVPMNPGRAFFTHQVCGKCVKALQDLGIVPEYWLKVLVDMGLTNLVCHPDPFKILAAFVAAADAREWQASCEYEGGPETIQCVVERNSAGELTVKRGTPG